MCDESKSKGVKGWNSEKKIIGGNCEFNSTVCLIVSVQMVHKFGW